MAVILSDSFNGMAADALVAGRTLDNGLGGSGTRSWGTSGLNGFESDGAGAVRQQFAAGEEQGVSLGADTNGKARFKFNSSNLAVNFLLFGKSNIPRLQGTAAISVLLVANGTTNALRLRNQALSDLAQTSISALSTSTDYYIELEINGSAIVGRILNGDLSVRNSVNYTYPSSPPTGNYWGFGTLAASNTAWRAGDFYMEDLAAGGSDPEPFTRTPRGVASGIARGVSMRTFVDFGRRLIARPRRLILPIGAAVAV